MVDLWITAALAVSSQITDVTVYSDRAQVIRSAEVQLEQGINTLKFDQLPEAIDSRGIQVTGSGDAVVLDVRFKTENFEEIPEEKWKALDDQLQTLRKQEHLIRLEIERQQEAEEFLKAISRKVTHASDKEDGSVSLDPGSWESMLALYTAKSREYDDAREKALLELEDVQKTIRKVEADIRDAGMTRRKKRRVVEVDLESPNAGNAALNLAYMVRGPKWIPTYDLRVDTETREMDVKYFALVKQNTGEDWNGVSLKLSTANPGLGGRHPELEPWRIRMDAPQGKRAKSGGFYSSVRGEAYAEYNAFDSDSAAQYAEAALSGSLSEPVAAPMKSRAAAVTRKGASVVFEVKGRSDIDSDNVEHRVAVSSVKLPAAFRYSTVPKLDPYAYLKAKVTNAGNHPFLEGKANVFLDGSFVAASHMELVAPDEEFWIFLGADESMKVEHKLIKKYQSKEGMTGKTTRHTYEYLMTVKNTHAAAEEVIVWDQLPISGSEGLKVKLLEPKYSKDTDSLKVDDEQRISWFRTLAPGEEWTIPYSFHVEAPKDMNISGLE